MKTVIYCISDINKALAFEWIVQGIDKNNVNLIFIIINSDTNSPLAQFLSQQKIKHYQLPFKNNFSYFYLIYKIYRILIKEKAKVIHCHLLKANIAGLTAAFLARLPVRIYTRHHSDFNYVYSRKGIWIDKYCNALATKIIAISKAVQDILIQREKADPSKVELIHHGFDLNYFKNFSPDLLDSLKRKYNPLQKAPVIGVISRFTEYKGLQYLIPAFQRLLKDYPNALLLMFNAKGEYTPVLDKLLAQLPPESYLKVDFEDQLSEVYRLFDCFVHIPDSLYSEAFGQVYVEALLCGIPSVFTISGIAPSIIQNQVNALTVDYKNSEATYLALKVLLEDPNLRSEISKNCISSDYFEFSLEKYIFKLEKLYFQNKLDVSH